MADIHDSLVPRDPENEELKQEESEGQNDEDEYLSDPEDETFDPQDPLQNHQLIRLVRTSAGADLYVNFIAQNALGRGNWGRLLGAAPDALGRLGQCFVLASDPLAASLVFPESAGLQYKSLRANLVHCSHLGRAAFRDAEAKMKKVSMVAQAVCEPGGTIDAIIEAVEDEDLAEIDLPEQLAALKRISEGCIEDTKAIKEKVGAWGDSAKSIYNACVDKDDDLGKSELDVADQIEIKELTVEQKKVQVSDQKKYTEEYRRQLAARQTEYNKSESQQNKGAWIDLGIAAGTALIDGAKHYFSPMSAISSIGSGISSLVSSTKGNSHKAQQQLAPDPRDPLAQRDAGYALAQGLQGAIHNFASLLTYEYGPEEFAGIDWDGLSGRDTTREKGIGFVQAQFRELDRQFYNEGSAITRQVRAAAKPAEEVADKIKDLVTGEGNMGQNTYRSLEENAPQWRKQVNGAQSTISDIIEAGYEQVKSEQNKQQKSNEEKDRLSQSMSRAKVRFERFRIAQQALFEAEERLTKRIDEEMKATEEFNTMELELQRLLSDKATMSEVKEIVGDCVKHLHYFCEKLDELVSFFTDLQNYVEDMDKTRVDPFRQDATVTKTIADRARTQESEAKKLRQEKLAQKKLEQLRLKALELKGYYLVAQAMADTYTEVSMKYIMPGVDTIGRLSLPEAQKLTKAERAQKVSKVGDMARKGKDDIRRLANARKRQIITAMSDNRGEIEEQKAIEN